MRKTKFHLVQYEWEGDLFNKEGVSKGAVCDPDGDPVISCSLSGRKTYLHPESGLALVVDDFGKTVENVIEGVTWVGPQYIEGNSVENFLETVRSSDGFELADSEVEIKEEETQPESISEAAEGGREYESLKRAVISRNGREELEYYGGTVYTATDIHCASLLQMIANSMRKKV